MADELQYYGDPASDSGLTVIARVYDSAGVQVGSDAACAEVGSLAIYQGDMPTTGAGNYGVRFFDGTTLLGQGLIDWDGSAEITNQTIDASIGALNNLSSADITAAVPTTSEIEAALLNEGDGQQLIDAIVQAIGNSNVDEIALVAAIRADIERSGGSLDTILADTNELQANQGNWLTATSVDLNNNAISSNTIQNNAFNNSAFTTGYYNSINAEVDTALTDYDAPTKAELDTAETNIIAAIPDVSGLSTFNPAIDTVARVTLVDTTTTNTDMRGTDGANTLAPDNAGITANGSAIANLNDLSSADVTSAVPTAGDIATQVETQILDENDGQQILNAIVGAIGNQNIDEVSLVAAIRADLERNGGSIDSLPTLADMEASSSLTAIADVSSLSTQSSVSSLQGDVTAILADTNELQANQGQWATAIGFATPANVTAAQNAIQSDIAGLNDITANDVWTSGVRTITGGTITTVSDKVGYSIAGTLNTLDDMNNFDPASDTVGRVTLVDTTTTNTDMRGTDGANTVAPDNTTIAATLIAAKLAAALSA